MPKVERDVCFVTKEGMDQMARPREFDTEQAVHGAMLLFWERGYRGTTVGDVQQTLGIGRASLYAAFGDKEGLFLRALGRYRERYSAPSTAALNADGPALDAVRAFFRGLVLRYTDSATPRGCLVTTTVMECAGLGGAIERALARSIATGEAALRRALRRARATGELPEGTDTRALARFLVAAGQGMALMARVTGSRTVVEDVARVALSVLR